jgi:hypothetical protein
MLNPPIQVKMKMISMSLPTSPVERMPRMRATRELSPPYSSGRRTSVLRPVVTGTDRLLCHTVAE